MFFITTSKLVNINIKDHKKNGDIKILLNIKNIKT